MIERLNLRCIAPNYEVQLPVLDLEERVSLLRPTVGSNDPLLIHRCHSHGESNGDVIVCCNSAQVEVVLKTTSGAVKVCTAVDSRALLAALAAPLRDGGLHLISLYCCKGWFTLVYPWMWINKALLVAHANKVHWLLRWEWFQRGSIPGQVLGPCWLINCRVVFLLGGWVSNNIGVKPCLCNSICRDNPALSSHFCVPSCLHCQGSLQLLQNES
mmetsp:Transcript_20040/g.36188  ORF Transcript_20040/g.36188 Transcript_20040/m.36188 type:complete len:214 (+) Transcript_20040:759-1400(+)